MLRYNHQKKRRTKNMKTYHFLLENEAGEQFLVEAPTFERALDVLEEYDIETEDIYTDYDILSDWEAENCGLDEF
jgi:ASC-1-like (ASCH) protein